MQNTSLCIEWYKPHPHCTMRFPITGRQVLIWNIAEAKVCVRTVKFVSAGNSELVFVDDSSDYNAAKVDHHAALDTAPMDRLLPPSDGSCSLYAVPVWVFPIEIPFREVIGYRWSTKLHRWCQVSLFILVILINIFTLTQTTSIFFLQTLILY